MSWEEVKARLAAARTLQERQDAAAALTKHISEEHRDKHLVIMQKGGVHAIRLDELHVAMLHHGPTYELVKKIISER